MGRSEKTTGSGRGLLEDESEFETASNNRGSVAGNQWKLNAQDLTKVLLSNREQPGSVGHPKTEVRDQMSKVRNQNSPIRGWVWHSASSFSGYYSLTSDL
jgi:hypothetical protein